MKKTGLFLLIILLASCTINNEARTSLEDKKEKKEKNIVCEKVYNTSSRIPKKICTTVAEREKRERDEEASKKILKDAQTRGGKVSGDLPKW